VCALGGNSRFCDGTRIGFLLVISAVLSAMALAGRAAIAAESLPQDRSTVAVRVPDKELVDQNGHTVHLYSDLVRGRKSVVISTMFTTCGTICPMVGVRMSALERSLGVCSHDEYSLISISVDPAVDTPERLREWGRKFGAGRCWTLLTGPKADVDAVLRALHLLPPDKLSHSPSALIGRDGASDWILCNVLTSPKNLLRIIRQKKSASNTTVPTL
jgi:protein SCO1/2